MGFFLPKPKTLFQPLAFVTDIVIITTENANLSKQMKWIVVENLLAGSFRRTQTILRRRGNKSQIFDSNDSLEVRPMWKDVNTK
jgi:hypothetical protein